MRDFVEIGPTPWEESCAQSSELDFRAKARKETEVFKGQILRTFGQPPEGVELRIAWSPHEYAAYPELRIYFDTEVGAEWAYGVEGKIPPRWDDESLAALPPKPPEDE
jgi:hypothetical protein